MEGHKDRHNSMLKPRLPKGVPFRMTVLFWEGIEINPPLKWFLEIFVRNGTYGVNMGPKSHLHYEGEHYCCGRAGMSKGLGSGQCVPCVAGGFGGLSFFFGALKHMFLWWWWWNEDYIEKTLVFVLGCLYLVYAVSPAMRLFSGFVYKWQVLGMYFVMS